MRKILYLSDTDILSPGGAQESMKILIEELNEYYDFVFLTPNGKKTNGNHIVLKKYNDFTLRGKSLIQITSLIKDIYKYIKKVEPTIIHVQMPSTMIIISFLKKFRLLNRNIRIIYTDRGVYGKYGKITTIAINNLIKKCEKVITTTYVNKKITKDYLRILRNISISSKLYLTQLVKYMIIIILINLKS